MEPLICPSGLTGHVRAFKLRDTETLTKPQLVREGRVYTVLLGDLWTETIDPGPYKLEQGKPDFHKVASSDRYAVLVRAGLLTHGPIFEWTERCRTSACGAAIPMRVDLTKLDCRPMDGDVRRGLAEGDGTELNFRGRKIRVRVLDGRDDAALQRVGREAAHRQITLGLARRMISIEGVGTHFDDMERWLGDLTQDAADELLQLIDDREGGYDFTVEVVCEPCGDWRMGFMPLGADFFSRRKQRPRPATAEHSST